VASGQDGQISATVVNDVLHDAAPSVSREMLNRFKEWHRDGAP
jgi:hypothetical protein